MVGWSEKKGAQEETRVGATASIFIKKSWRDSSSWTDSYSEGNPE